MCILSIQYLQKRKTGDKKNETRKASSFRRKGTLSRGLVVAGKAYLKKEKKKPTTLVTSGSRGNSKVTEARAAKPGCGPVTRHGSQERVAWLAPGWHTPSASQPRDLLEGWGAWAVKDPLVGTAMSSRRGLLWGLCWEHVTWGGGTKIWRWQIWGTLVFNAKLAKWRRGVNPQRWARRGLEKWWLTVVWGTPSIVNANSGTRNFRLSSVIWNIWKVGWVSILDSERWQGRAAPLPSLGLWLPREETGPWARGRQCHLGWSSSLRKPAQRLGAKPTPSVPALPRAGCTPLPPSLQTLGAWEPVH